MTYGVFGQKHMVKKIIIKKYIYIFMFCVS